MRADITAEAWGIVHKTPKTGLDEQQLANVIALAIQRAEIRGAKKLEAQNADLGNEYAIVCHWKERVAAFTNALEFYRDRKYMEKVVTLSGAEVFESVQDVDKGEVAGAALAASPAALVEREKARDHVINEARQVSCECSKSRNGHRMHCPLFDLELAFIILDKLEKKA